MGDIKVAPGAVLVRPSVTALALWPPGLAPALAAVPVRTGLASAGRELVAYPATGAVAVPGAGVPGAEGGVGLHGRRTAIALDGAGGETRGVGAPVLGVRVALHVEGRGVREALGMGGSEWDLLVCESGRARGRVLAAEASGPVAQRGGKRADVPLASSSRYPTVPVVARAPGVHVAVYLERACARLCGRIEALNVFSLSCRPAPTSSIGSSRRTSLRWTATRQISIHSQPRSSSCVPPAHAKLTRSGLPRPRTR